MSAQAVVCAGCATELAPGLLCCPACARLVHAGRLTDLAARAGAAERMADWTGALSAWREALPLLPPGSRQRASIEQKVALLSARVGSRPASTQPWWKRLSSLGPVGIVLAILGKAKFLLLGFSKLGTLLSFFVALSVYWALWGWQFALGFLLCIYVHEMGHVSALLRYGIPASAPMFIPGFGALVRLKQNPASPVEDARVGLAGPIWGLGACIACLAIFAVSHNPFWTSLARAGAWINLFNLLPVWQLDGGRGLRSLARSQVWILALLAAAMWLAVSDGLLILIAVLLGYRALSKRDDSPPDWVGLMQFSGLLVALALLCLIPLPKAGA